jgi:hypothetical protein
VATLVENPVSEPAQELGKLGTLCVIDTTGDSRMQWDQNSPDQVAAARRRFEELKARGYVGHRVDASGAMSEEIRDFDPTAERIIMNKRLVGG